MFGLSTQVCIALESKHFMKHIGLSVTQEGLSQCHEHLSSTQALNNTMHNKFSNVLCFASFCAHLCAISNNFNHNGENRI